MKIGIDAQVISRNQAGVTYYTRGLVEEIMRRDRKNRYDLMTLPPLAYRFYYKLHKWGIRIPLEVFFGSHDLYFFPNYVVYPHRRGRAVVVVHDLTFERVPRWVQPANVEFLRRFVPPSVEKADHVVAVSEFTKKDLIKIYGLPGKKITVVPPAVDPQLFKPQPESRIRAVKKRYGIRQPYLLYLGTLEPRKNVPALIRAFGRLPNRKNLSLVLAGQPSWRNREILEAVKESGAGNSLVFTGYVAEEDRPALLAGAEVFVFPSFFEGFGMPVLEAQACGTPVVASNTTSLPEVAGKGAVLVDPQSVEDLAGAVAMVLDSRKVRDRLVKQGRRNIRRYTWENSAQKAIKIFNSFK